MPRRRALERALVEHLDCCQYRLDAWETGLFAQRLQAQRRTRLGDERQHRDLPRRIRLGRATQADPTGRLCDRRTCRRRLQPDGRRTAPRRGRSRRREADRSPSGAASCTRPRSTTPPRRPLLRNAYLSHASRHRSDMLSVNLSSERVRRAQFVLEGMRNGQPIEALLGYQFERGAARSHLGQRRARRCSGPGAQPVHRSPTARRFPFESREIAQAGTGAGDRNRAAVQRRQWPAVDDRHARCRQRLRPARRYCRRRSCRTRSRAPRSWRSATRCSTRSTPSRTC